MEPGAGHTDLSVEKIKAGWGRGRGRDRGERMIQRLNEMERPPGNAVLSTRR